MNQPSADDNSWQPSVLAALRDCGTQRPRWRLLRWTLNFLAFVATFLFIFAGSAFLRDLSRGGGNDPAAARVLTLLWIPFVILVLIRFRNRFLRHLWRAAARNAEDELSKPGARRPILYLRSFQLDKRIGRPSWLEILLGTYPLENAEQRITKALRGLGPVIAIGRPGEKLPPLGAARFYVSHDRWQEKVAAIAKEAQFVLWASGNTEGLRWEISHLIGNLPCERLVVWAHPQLLRLKAAKREAEWARFRESLGDLFPKRLPEQLGRTHFIRFAADWEPVPVSPPRTWWPWANASDGALRALLDARNTPASVPAGKVS